VKSPSRHPLLPLLLLSLPLVHSAGCSGGGGSSAYSATDSAGVRIIETRQLTWEAGEEWSVSPEPLLEIGERDGEDPYQFFQLAGGLRLPDGRIVVLNSGSTQIRIFSGDGRFLTEFGGQGDGPEEFRAVSAVKYLGGDTLLIWDVGRPGFSLFNLSGDFIGSQRLTPPGTERFSTVHPLADDRLLLTTYASLLTEFAGQGVGIHRDRAPLLVASLDGDALDTIGVFPSVETMIMEFGGTTGIGAPPFLKSTYFGVGNGSVYVGTAENLEVSVLDTKGDLKALFRYPDIDLSVQ